MSIADVTNFRKVDLHIHTPQSTCYSDKSVTAGQIIEAALSARLDAIAVTDHNTFGGIESIRREAEGKNLHIFPGAELSLKSGHFLAIFDVGTPISKLQPLLVEIGVKQEDHGDGAVLVEGEAEEVFKKVNARGGIIVASHIERWPSGFLESSEPRKIKMAIHSSPYLSALEITVANDKKLWNDGQVRGFPTKRACIQSSDAHAPADIGRRPVFIKMKELDLANLKSAFNDYENSIVFPDELEPGR